MSRVFGTARTSQLTSAKMLARPAIGMKVVVDFPCEQPANGVIVDLWDNSWYHITFLAEPGRRESLRDMVKF